MYRFGGPDSGNKICRITLTSFDVQIIPITPDGQIVLKSAYKPITVGKVVNTHTPAVRWNWSIWKNLIQNRKQ